MNSLAEKNMNQQEKATRNSWKSLQMLETKKQVSFERRFTEQEFEKISFGVIPQQMEDKWFIFLEDMQLNFHRSWTGQCIYQIRFEKNIKEFIITEAWVNRNQEEYRNTDDDYDVALLSFLIDNFILGKNSPFPMPNDLPSNLPKGVYQHTVVGTGYPETHTKLNLLSKTLNYIQSKLWRKS